MRHAFYLIPAAVVAAAAPASAKIYLTEKQAQNLMYPGATFTEKFLTLDADKSNFLSREANAPIHAQVMKAWQVKATDGSEGWFILDQVEGKGDIITYAIALDDQGIVKRIEILECVADYDTIIMPKWRAQFTGRKVGDPMTDIKTISGATLSSRHIAEGVRRVLLAYTHYIKPES